MVGRPPGTGGQAKELSRQEIKRIDQCLINTLHEYRNRALFFLGLGSGMRIAEMCQLSISDIATLNSTKKIEILPAVVLERHSTKSKQSRTVYLSKQASSNIKQYIEGRTLLKEAEPLFPSQMDRRQALRANTAVIILSKMFKIAGIKHASSHLC